MKFSESKKYLTNSGSNKSDTYKWQFNTDLSFKTDDAKPLKPINNKNISSSTITT